MLKNLIRHKDLLSVTIIFLLAFIFFLKGFLQNQIIWGFDTPKIIFPLIFLLDESFKHFQLPLWTPNIYFGFPIGAEGQIGWFYILNFLHIFLPLNLAISFLSALHVSLAGIFTYIFCRLIKLNRFASLFAGIVFMFNGFIMAHLQFPAFIYAYAFLPLILILVELAIRNNKIIFFALAGAMFGIQLPTGHPNIPIMTLIYVTLYCSTRLFNNKYLLLKGMLVLVGVATLTALPYLLQTMFLMPLSIRSGGVDFADATNSSFSFFDFITFFFPNFYFNSLQPWTTSITWHFWSYWGQVETTGYVGIMTLFLAPFAFLKETRKKAMLFFTLLLIGLILALGKNTPLYGILLNIPIFDGLRAPGRFLFLVDFSLAILAGVGITALFNTDKMKKIKINIAIILISCLICVVVMVGFWIAKFYPEQIYYFILQNYSKLGYVANLDNFTVFQQMIRVSFQEQTKIGLFLIAISTLLILLILNGFKNWLIQFVILILIIVDLFLFAGKVNTWKNFNELINAADPNINKLKNELTYKTGRIYSFGSFWSELMPDRLIPHHIPEANGFVSLPLKRFENWQKEAEAQWLKGKANLFKIGSVKYIYDKSNLTAIDNPLPRVYIASKWLIAKNSLEALNLVSADDFDLNTVVLETDNFSSFSGVNISGIRPAVISIYKPDYVKITYNSPNDGILVLTDTNYPGWKAYLNSQNIPIYQANYLFRAVQVPAGSDIIEFKYEPALLNEAIVLSVGSTMILLSFFATKLFKRGRI